MSALAPCPVPAVSWPDCETEYDERIAAAKEALGDRLIILGHHYQRDEIIKFADYTGDSLKLARQAAQHPTAEFIVFCGVHFMAESADVLSAPHQKVILPDLSAGCSMADMADIDQVEECWQAVEESCRGVTVPVTYINSTADLKAFVARHDGTACTSSNAAAVLEWALARGDRVLFFPDQHLGRNTGVQMGIGLDEMVVYDPRSEYGGCEPEQLDAARIILWKGHCSVHQMFRPEHVESIRQTYPNIKVLVHRECCYEVVQMADLFGSTETIIRHVDNAPEGSEWAIGTEINLVHRLAWQHPEQRILSLNPNVCVCATMYRIDPAHLCRALEALVDGQVINQIVVPEEVATQARTALDRMLSIT